jgi:PDZ domain
MTMTQNRPSRISVTFLWPAEADVALLWEFLGLEVCLNRCQGQVVIMSVNEVSVLANKLQVGDVLATINGSSCQNVEIPDISDLIAEGGRDEASTEAPEAPGADQWNGLTLTFLCPEGDDDLVSAIAIPPSYNASDSIDNNETVQHDPFDLGLILDAEESRRFRRKNSQKRVVIREVCSDGWLAQSVLQAGDSVLSVNDESADGWSLDDVAGILSAAKSGYTAIAILATTVNRVNDGTNNQRPSWRQKVRRASVTLGGGVLVTTGAVLMVTPLHPIGHAMAIGGVAILGGFRRKKDKLAEEGDATKEDSDVNKEGDETSPEEDAGPSDLTDEAEVEPPTVSDETQISKLEAQAA